MSKMPAPSAKALLAQATELWPNRNKASDGIVPSAAHTAANPNSDHEPGSAGYCHAVDLTHDPVNGCDCAAITERLRASRDPRIKYVIFNRRMFSSYPTSTRTAWAWGAYTGSNPHDKHMHMSILDTKAACEDTSRWPIGGAMPTLNYAPAGWVRFWRVTKAPDRIYSADPAEITALVDNGWTYDGPCFDISLTDPTNDRDLHRFVLGNGLHFFTADPDEAARISAHEINGVHEAVVAKVGTRGVQVRRFYHEPQHLLTADPTERPDGFTDQGIAFGCGIEVTNVPEPQVSDCAACKAQHEAILDKVLASAQDIIKTVQ